jgi:hypothetical protein
MTRNKDGTFATGNPGGPGRSRRATERDYLRALSEACPPETWEKICKKAVEAAETGDPKARDWLARHLLGDVRLSETLTDREATERALDDSI